MVELMGGKDVTPREVIAETEQDKQALSNAKKRSGRFDYFGVLGITVGTTLTFSKDNTITCEVIDDRQVKFRDQNTSLSASALIIINEMGYEWNQINGAAYWCYRGKTLVDLRFEHES